MKRKLMMAFFLVALIPLGLLAYLNTSTTRTALTEEANQDLFAVASETAASLDSFISINLDAASTEAQLPALVQFLSLPDDERSGSEEETQALDILRALSRKDEVNITSYALLDSQGQIVVDTFAPDIGVDASGSSYFQEALQTDEAYVSPVEFSPTTGEAGLTFSSPVHNESGEFIGVLRVRYDANVLQQLLAQKNGLAGQDSFGVLFDEHHIHLAHGAAPETLFTAVGPLGPSQVGELQAAGRLPDLPANELTMELNELEENLSNMSDQPFFTAEDVATGERVNQVAVTTLETEPWIVAFFQPQDVFLAQVQAQTRTTALLAAAIAVAVAVAAVSMGQLLANPIINLTSAVSRFTEGDLDARVQSQSNDETGVLADSFNTMAEQVGNLVKRQAEQNRELGAEVSARKYAEAQLQTQNMALTQANRDLEEARKKAEDATRLKSEFLATMSHELRTPLNAIIGYSQIILRGIAGELTEQQYTNQERILENGKNLLRLIDDVLDLAKIEARRMAIVKSPFVVRDWLEGLVHQVESLAGEKGLKLESALDERMRETIVGDADHLRQITLNLLSNAIKFTKEGTVKINIQRQTEGRWALMVSDTGIGIPSHAQEYIFEEFRQVDGTWQRKHGGTGLGLAIVRNLAMTMGGNVRVTSQVGEGSTFTVLLPLDVPDSESVGESAATLGKRV
jgi:signal transduction histidine kinase